jgi:excinuclease ABC subunit C
MEQTEFYSIQKTLPNSPGIYKYFGANKQLLYIGKAKNIRKRVSSYFNKNNHSYKTNELVRQIIQIEFTIVESEHDALLLENSLIKEFKPKYNIVLKDDKTYPYIAIKKEAFSRVFLTRRKINDQSEYIGPFTSTLKVRDLITFIKTHIPLRTCNLALNQTNIQKNKFKVCLEYHLGNCKAPCVGLQSIEDYNKGLDNIRHILKGNFNEIITEYKTKQKEFITSLAFEKAEHLQQKINNLKDYQAKSIIVSPRLGDMDVFGMATFEDNIVISFLAVRNGTITNSKISSFSTKIEETNEDLLSQSIIHFQTLVGSNAKELIIPFPIEFGLDSFKMTIPKNGEKKKLLTLAETNANYFIEEMRKKKMLHLNDKNADKKLLLKNVKAALSLKNIPTHIECFDNSNFQGAYPVSAMVCFKNGIPSKSDYRHFNVQTVQGINDFATMKEAVTRRYKRLKAEDTALPQLVIIDGGKGQLSAAAEAIEALDLTGQMTLVGLAKNQEELFFVGDQESLKLGYDSEVLRFIRSIRDEVHNYGVTFHRQQRSKGTFVNELESIHGIGPQTARELLTHFRSVKKIKEARVEDIAAVVGKTKANLIHTYFEQ